MKRILFALLALFAVGLILATPISAQPPTDEPPVEATPEPTPESPVEPAPSADTYISISTLIFGLIVAVLGGGTVGVIINRFGTSRANLDAAEKLFLSFPPETRDLINNLTNALDSALDIIRKITDGQPNDEPPASLNMRSYPPKD